MLNVELSPVLHVFEGDAQKSLTIVKDAALYKEHRNGQLRSIPKRRLYLIIELSFLKLFISGLHDRQAD